MLCAVPLIWPGERLKIHAHASGVRLIGDLPFFVSPDSSDVWANPDALPSGSEAPVTAS